jgi:hypothetical protein
MHFLDNMSIGSESPENGTIMLQVLRKYSDSPKDNFII